VQTDVVHVVVRCARRIQPMIGWSGTSVAVMMPPGTSRISGDGTSSNDACARTSRKARLVDHRARLRRDEHDFGVRQRREDLERPERVEGGEAVVESDGDLHGAVMIRAGRSDKARPR
jgi:hypothetical protein